VAETIEEFLDLPDSPSIDGLTERIIDALLPTDLYNAGYRAGRRAFAETIHDLLNTEERWQNNVGS
jgi:hypothetical protein